MPRPAAPPDPPRLAALDDAPCTYDGVIVFLAATLMTFGVVMVYSASVSLQGAPVDWHNWWQSPLKQFVFSAAGFLAMWFTAHLNYRWLRWERLGDGWVAGGVWGLALLALVAMHLFGAVQMGARRSINVPGGISIQPAEFAKIGMIVWLAALMTYRGFDVRSLRGFGIAVGSCGLLVVLVAKEDLGTGALLGVVMVFLLLAGGARWWHLAAIGLVGLAGGVGLILLEPYRRERIMTFIAAQPDVRGEGYQIKQALLAIGSGGWWGRGLGNGIQKYDYLPQDNNDFILAIICEELGIVGGIAVAVLFLAFLWRGWWVARTAPDKFGRLVALGLTLTICLQAAFNIGVVTQSIPTKGISLPFVSAGGSGVVFLGVAAGLLASVGRREGRGSG